MQTGKISKLFPETMHGKIWTTGGKEAHFHRHCLLNVQFSELFVGRDVMFEAQETYNGMIAFEIRPDLKKEGRA